ncbi:MAG: GntR family transcriptional regulator [Bryobacter sp.]
MNQPFARKPLYQKLNQELRKSITSGQYPPGQQFLSERQVAEQFSVSRVTANKVLASLVGEGLLEFRKGLGTFVAAPKYDYNLRSLVSFTAMVDAHKGRPETRVLVFRQAREIPKSLEVAPMEACYYMERLRCANGLPVILERRWVREKFCPGLTKAELKGSIYELWARKYFLSVAGAEQTIRAVLLNPEEAAALECPVASAGLLNTSTGYLQDRVPLWFEQTLYRGDAYEFFNRLGTIEQPRPAEGRLIR